MGISNGCNDLLNGDHASAVLDDLTDRCKPSGLVPNYHELFFGSFILGRDEDVPVQTVTLTNMGRHEIRLLSVKIKTGTENFALAGNTVYPRVVQPGESFGITVKVSFTKVAQLGGTIEINTNEDRLPYVIGLGGRVVGAAYDEESFRKYVLDRLTQSEGQTEAWIITERSARADGDEAEARLRTQLGARLRQETEALITIEQTARANQFEAEASERVALEASVKGYTDASIIAERSSYANQFEAAATERNALEVRVNNRTDASILTERNATATMFAAEATERTTMEARVKGYTDASIIEERTITTNKLAAEAAARLVLEASLKDDITSRIERESAARATAIAAEAIDRLKLESNLRGYVVATFDAESTTRATADEALSLRVTKLEADFSSPVVDAEARARITEEQEARATALLAEAAQRLNLSAYFTSQLGETNARIDEESFARSTADEAFATRSSRLEGQLNLTIPSLMNTKVVAVDARVDQEALIRLAADRAEAAAREELETRIFDDVDGYLASAAASAERAAVSEFNAEGSASNARNSASTAAASSNSAGSSADIATTKAAASLLSASNANQSALDALAQYNKAAAEALKALGYSTDALRYSGDAQTYSNQASGSATNAAGSASAANLSAGTAASSARDATTAKDLATVQAGLAGGYRSDALTYSTQASQSATNAAGSAAAALLSQGTAAQSATTAGTKASDASESARVAGIKASEAVVSAGTAAQKAIDAQTEANKSAASAVSAKTQADLALTYKGDAFTYSSQASQSAVNAAGSATAAALSSGTAAGSASASDTARIASEAAANNAGIAQYQSALSKQGADAAAALANTYKSDAQTFSNQASQSATNAAGSAASASAAQVTAAGSLSSAIKTVAVSLPTDFAQSDTFWMSGWAGNPDQRPSNNGWTFVVTPEGIAATITKAGTSDISHRGLLPLAANRRYRETIRARKTSSGSLYLQGYIPAIGSDQTTDVGTDLLLINVPLTSNFADYTAEFYTSDLRTTAAYTRGFARLYPPSGTVETGQIVRIRLEDITSETTAANKAAAAAASATTANQKAIDAATQANNAANEAVKSANQAAAALGYRDTASAKAAEAALSASQALTYRGDAFTYAGQASGSATNAAGSASAANTSAGTSASSASAADTAKLAAQQAASNASGSEYQSNVNRQLAEGAATLANTYKSDAKTFSDAASQSATNALGSSASAAMQAGVAASSAVAAQAAQIASGPTTLTDAKGLGFTQFDSGSPDQLAPIGLTLYPATFLNGLWGSTYIRPVQVVPATPGKVYEVEGAVYVDVYSGNGTNVYCFAGTVSLRADYTYINENRASKSGTSTGPLRAKVRVSDVADSALGIQAWTPGTVWLRASVQGGQDYAGNTIRATEVRIKDVTSEVTATKSATAAAGSASTASASQTAAGQSAAASSSSAVTAATSASEAGGAALTQNNNPGMAPSLWTNDWGSLVPRASESVAALIARIPQAYSIVNQRVRVTGNGQLHTGPSKAIPFVKGRRYRWTKTVRAVVEGDSMESLIMSFDRDGNQLGYDFFGGPILSATADSIQILTFGDGSTPADFVLRGGDTQANRDKIAWFRPVIIARGNGNNNTAVTEIINNFVVDVESELMSLASATAAATSATAASASNTLAGQRADAARQSELNAGTFAGTATTKASEAVASAANAQGYSNSAYASQVLTAQNTQDAQDYRNKAARSASAALISEQNAATSQNAAGISAQAASNSATAASTSSGQAGGSATTAANKASEANTSAATAAQKAVDAQTEANRSAQKATDANTSAGIAAARASDAATSAAQALTYRGDAFTYSSQASQSATNAAGSASAANTSAGTSAASEAASNAAAIAANVASKATMPDNFNNALNWREWNNWGGSVTFANGLANIKSGGSFHSRFMLPIAAGEFYRVTARHRVINQGGGETYVGIIELSPYETAGAHAWQVLAKGTAAVGVWEVTSFEFTAEYVFGNYGPIPAIGIAFLTGYPNKSDAEVSMFRIENITSERLSKKAAAESLVSSGSASTYATQASQSASNAAGSASTAQNQAGLAAQSKTDANNAATAAQSSAAVANTKSGEAGASATAANQSRIDAQAANTAANASAVAANASKVAADASAASAVTSSNQSSTFASAAAMAVAPTLPSKFDQGSLFWRRRWDGPPTRPSDIDSIWTFAGGNAIYYGNGGGNNDIAQLGALPYRSDRKYRMTVRWQVIDAGGLSSVNAVMYFIGMTGAYDSANTPGKNISISGGQPGWGEAAGYAVSVFDLNPGDMGTIVTYVRGLLRMVPGATQRFRVDSISVEDVTAELKADKGILDAAANTASISSLAVTVAAADKAVADRATILEAKATLVATTHIVRAKGTYGTVTGGPPGLFNADGSRIGIVPARGYNVYIKSLTTDAWVSENFDTFGQASRAIDMGNMLGTAARGSIVVIVTFDEPWANRLAPHLVNWMGNTGSNGKFASSAFKQSGAYILVGTILGLYGSGIEWYAGTNDYGSDAYLDKTFSRVGNSLDTGNSDAVALKDVTARTSATESAVVDLKTGRATARVEFVAQTPGGRASVTIKSDSVTGSGIDLGGDVNFNGNLKVQKTVGGKTIMIDSDTGITFNNGTIMKIMGVAFGSVNQFMEWTGPSLSSLSQCTESNAYSYTKTDGSGYFGGSLNAGALRNASTSSSTELQTLAELVSFGSNGKPVKYICSWVYRTQIEVTYPATSQGVQQYNQAAASFNANNADNFGTITTQRPATTLTLARAFQGSNLEQLNQASYTTEQSSFQGFPPTVGDAPGKATIIISIGGSFTMNDPVNNSGNRNVRLGLNRGYNLGSGNISQRVSLIAVEE